VQGIRVDLTVNWTSHESREAAIRRKIKRLRRKHHYRPPAPKRGQDYVSIFADLDAGRAIFATEGRDAAVYGRFVSDLEAHGGSARRSATPRGAQGPSVERRR